MQIKIAHSPDSDDYFFFWAIAEKKIDTEGLSFSIEQHPTNVLNELAATGTFDIIAISVAAYPTVAHQYEIFPYGASVGRNYGPKVVAKREMQLSELNSLRVAVPGLNTTACAVFQMLAPSATLVEIPIEPFESVFNALTSNAVDAAVLIHEGQIQFEKYGLHALVDLGVYWQKETGLPLPLGINVIKRNLPIGTQQSLKRVVKHAIDYAKKHPEDLKSGLAKFLKSRGRTAPNNSELSTYLDMFANADSLEIKDDVKQGIDKLCALTKIHLSPNQ